MNRKRREQNFTEEHVNLARKCVNNAMKAAGIYDENALGIDREDLMQEAYIAMNKAYGKYNEKHSSKAKLETYLYACVKNKTASEIKRITRMHKSEEEGKQKLLASKQFESERVSKGGSLSEPLLDSVITDIAEKAAPHIRHADKEKLAVLLKALSAYDFQKAAAESVGVSKDMMKHIMKDFRKFLKDNPEEAELLKMSLMDGV